MKSPELFLTLIEAKLCLLKIGTRSMDPQIKVAMAGHGRRLEQIIGAKWAPSLSRRAQCVVVPMRLQGMGRPAFRRGCAYGMVRLIIMVLSLLPLSWGEMSWEGRRQRRKEEEAKEVPGCQRQKLDDDRSHVAGITQTRKEEAYQAMELASTYLSPERTALTKWAPTKNYKTGIGVNNHNQSLTKSAPTLLSRKTAPLVWVAKQESAQAL